MGKENGIQCSETVSEQPKVSSWLGLTTQSGPFPSPKQSDVAIPGINTPLRPFPSSAPAAWGVCQSSTALRVGNPLELHHMTGQSVFQGGRPTLSLQWAFLKYCLPTAAILAVWLTSPDRAMPEASGSFHSTSSFSNWKSRVGNPIQENRGWCLPLMDICPTKCRAGEMDSGDSETRFSCHSPTGHKMPSVARTGLIKGWNTWWWCRASLPPQAARIPLPQTCYWTVPLPARALHIHANSEGTLHCELPAIIEECRQTGQGFWVFPGWGQNSGQKFTEQPVALTRKPSINICWLIFLRWLKGWGGLATVQRSKVKHQSPRNGSLWRATDSGLATLERTIAQDGFFPCLQLDGLRQAAMSLWILLL